MQLQRSVLHTKGEWLAPVHHGSAKHGKESLHNGLAPQQTSCRQRRMRRAVQVILYSIVLLHAFMQRSLFCLSADCSDRLLQSVQEPVLSCSHNLLQARTPSISDTSHSHAQHASPAVQSKPAIKAALEPKLPAPVANFLYSMTAFVGQVVSCPQKACTYSEKALVTIALTARSSVNGTVQ